MKKLKLYYYSLPISILRIINLFSSKLYNPILFDFVNSPIGVQFGLNKHSRLKILKNFIRVNNNIESATSLETQITLAKYLLSLPKVKRGVVVECGCFKGASAAALSIICKIIGRKLILYDSFMGLPKTANRVRANFLHLKSKEIYKAEMYKGTLNDVKRNIAVYGDVDVCIFRKGQFHKSLKYHNEKIEFIFLDVDLVESTKICMKHLWNKIVDNSYIFTDDSCDLENAEIWFDNKWWRELFRIKAPGYVGSGCGLPLNSKYSGLGYTIKKPNKKKFKKVNWIN